MPTIYLNTFILATPEEVFDLSRNIDLHQISTQQTKEKVVAGKMSGLIGPGESVTWRAKHFGFFQELTSKITAFEKPHSFTDEMVKGAFKSFKHIHKFEEKDNGTLMTDVFIYISPLGILGKLADYLFLQKYMENLLTARNTILKKYAEKDKNREVLPLSTLKKSIPQ
ncbi:ligand-binding SRPBCC domain-containing protein [Pedobacter cryoconitis]|uniref:Ligand-binding SRPBCC domain-containing protein n=1 Tax=Pedobacter cryoconitis TaxID=188932 RepID=A0A7W9E1P2_9SPHI|nr:SRPBCC family protein [Pedobacter cryoconitis]MBB5638454.1 ligand-binding SRPBCC domain-containing protein [Pedobacter cryoconitis]